MTALIKDIATAAAAGGAVAFIQTAEALAIPHWSEEPWWPIAGAVATFVIGQLQKLEKKEADEAAKK